MADTDRSLYNLRYNQVTRGMEGFGGGSPMWTPLTLSADGGVTSLNSLTGSLSLVAGSNITLTPSGSDITIAASGGGGPVASLSLTNQGADSAGSAFDSTANSYFGVLRVIDATHLLIAPGSTSPQPGDTVTQGINTATVVAMTAIGNEATSSMQIANTAGWVGGPVLFTPSTTGLYQIAGYMVTTTPDAGAGAIVGVGFGFTDDSGLTGDSSVIGGNLTVAQSNYGNAAWFEFVAGQPVTYCLFGGGTYGAAKYSLYITATLLG